MLDAPLEHITVLSDGYDQPVISELDLKKENINTIIWAGGYSYDYSLVKLPVYDADGFPEQVGGVTSFPGLYFVGLPWLPSNKSGLLLGVAENARYIALNILEEKTDSMPEKVS
jgi:putative flavoprotein involved in K+ transport